jgi:hypothetical protein
MSDNLALWNRVERTPENQTKKIVGKSYSGNSPKPHYLVHKATETFGPIGIGWGFTIEDERIEEGAGGEKLHIARVKVWYKWGGERGEVEHVGGTQFSGLRSSGKPFTDEDAPKKSVTDALVKALSMIGFAGDIFMGRYDDSKYLAELRANEAQQSAPPRQDAPKEEPKKPVSAAEMKRGLEAIDADLTDCHSVADVNKCAKIWAAIMERDGWTKDYTDMAKPKFASRRETLGKDDGFPGDAPSRVNADSVINKLRTNTYAQNVSAG